MTTQNESSTGNEPGTSLKEQFDALKSGSVEQAYTAFEVRMDRLTRLETILTDHQRELAAAVDEDFSGRPAIQTRMEILGALGEIRHAKKNLKKWMKPDTRAVPIIQRLTGARAEVVHQPLGVIGVMAPWNYPIVLSFGALAGVFAAGNVAMMKPSELSPKTSELTKVLTGRYFSKDELITITGGPGVGQVFVQLPFDHLLFAGGPSVAKHVMRAASENLVPVTLELGGKCPVIIADDADMALAVDRIIWGKYTNAGQICLAPDYVFIPTAKVEEFVSAARNKIASWHAKPEHDSNLCSIINDGHHQRLSSYIDEAKERGTRLEDLTAPNMRVRNRQLALTLFIQPDEDLKIMQEDVFGPLLSVLTYDSMDDVINFINKRPRVLALYYFGFDSNQIQTVKEKTVTGGMTVNDIAIHAGVPTLPLVLLHFIFT